jgi:hypothetical protein
MFAGLSLANSSLREVFVLNRSPWSPQADSVAKRDSPTSQYEVWRSLIESRFASDTFLGIAIFATKLMGNSLGAPPEHRFWRMPRKRLATKSATSGHSANDLIRPLADLGD